MAYDNFFLPIIVNEIKMNEWIWIILPYSQGYKIDSTTYGISLQLADPNYRLKKKADPNYRDLFTQFFNIQISINEILEFL